MKVPACILAVWSIAAMGAVAEPAVSTQRAISREATTAAKDRAIHSVPDPSAGSGSGDTIADALPIPELPFSDAGNSCSFVDDTDEACPYAGSTSPDVVYSFTATLDRLLDVSLCASLYDTKLYVYENAPTTLVACNDDACGADGFKSRLLDVPVTAGNTYYFVVDGYGGDCGEYSLVVEEAAPCHVICPSGGVAEGEVDCFDGYEDETNAGCTTSPPQFGRIPGAEGLTVCGTYGGFSDPATGSDARDTDWFEFECPDWPRHVCFTGVYETVIGYADATLGCSGDPGLVESLVVPACETGCLDLPPYSWLFVATSGFGEAAGPCGGRYNLEVGELPFPCYTAVVPTGWGKLKARYR
ncbi:MAG: hypothetical protein R3B81_02590 [bacterium]